MSKISCFADCGECSLVMRVPYELAVKIINYLPDDDDKAELLDKMKIASRRSKVFHSMLDTRCSI